MTTYLTIKKRAKYSITLEEFLALVQEEQSNKPTITQCNETTTIKIYGDVYDKFKERAQGSTETNHDKLTALHNTLTSKGSFTIDVNKEYFQFTIPKATGGVRVINAPSQKLKDIQSTIVEGFKGMGLLHNNIAYAYINQRSCKQAIHLHSQNNSRHYAKFDLKSFFPSCTLEIIMRQLSLVHPFTTMLETYPDTINLLTDIIKLCLLDGVLPQGSPASPYISNIIMIPLDYELNRYAERQNFAVTRYADDIILSSATPFSIYKTEGWIKGMMKPFILNTEKTRYGKITGANWNLGLMTNKDNDVTVGHIRKKLLKKNMYKFIKDFPTPQRWGIIETQSLLGQIAYLNHIEPKYTAGLLKWHREKYNVPIKNMIMEIIR